MFVVIFKLSLGFFKEKFTLYVGLFLVFLISRFFFLPYLNPDWFLGDEIFDICIKPWQLFSGEIGLRDKTALPLAAYGIIARLGGLDFILARQLTSIYFSILMLILFDATNRIFGLRVAVLSSLILLFSHQMILRSLVATTMPSGFLFLLWFFGY